MPNAQSILAQLSAATNEFSAVSIAWHVLLCLALTVLISGRVCPSQRAVAALLTLPALSVALIAWATGNAFNGALFLSITALLWLLAFRLPSGVVRRGPPWAFWLGALGTAYAALYPHFVATESLWLQAIAAPLGVVPCPTLALIAAGSLLADGFRSRTWSRTVATLAGVYALVGLSFLSVWWDVGLLLLAVGLLVHAGRSSAAVDDTERERIEAFLGSGRIALVGASADPQHFSRIVMAELIKHGIDVVPVHPLAAEIAGCTAFSRVEDVEPPVQGALVMTPATQSARVVEECAETGIPRVWLHRGVGQGAVSQQAIEMARRLGLQLVAGRCPLMFLGHPPDSIHRLHASLLRAAGRYPEQRRSSAQVAD